jgi:hypothetical protein
MMPTCFSYSYCPKAEAARRKREAEKKRRHLAKWDRMKEAFARARKPIEGD